MPTESELRALLHGEPGTTRPLDAERIIRAARARRRPKRIAAGALGGLAALALVIPVVVGVGTLGPRTVSDRGGAAAPAESAEGFSTRADDGSLAPDASPGCRPPGWDGEAAPTGLELRVAQSTPGGALELTLVNGSGTTLHGRLAGPPLVAVSDGETPLGWSAAAPPAASASERLALAPGGQHRVEVPLEIDSCSGAPVTGAVEAAASIAIVLEDGTILVADSARSRIVVAPAE